MAKLQTLSETQKLKKLIFLLQTLNDCEKFTFQETFSLVHALVAELEFTEYNGIEVDYDFLYEWVEISEVGNAQFLESQFNSILNKKMEQIDEFKNVHEFHYEF